jgi:hypothetical protein
MVLGCCINIPGIRQAYGSSIGQGFGEPLLLQSKRIFINGKLPIVV